MHSAHMLINSRWKNKGKKLKIAHGRPRLMDFQHWNITTWWSRPVGIQSYRHLVEKKKILICLVKTNSRLGLIFFHEKVWTVDSLEHLDMVPIPHVVKLVEHLLIQKLADEKGRARSCLHWTIWPEVSCYHVCSSTCVCQVTTFRKKNVF